LVHLNEFPLAINGGIAGDDRENEHTATEIEVPCRLATTRRLI
jgi:hypothetical protein